MTTGELIVIVAGVLIPSLTAMAVAIIREIRKNAPNGVLLSISSRLRRLEQRVARYIGPDSNPPDHELDAEVSGEFRGITPGELNNGE